MERQLTTIKNFADFLNIILRYAASGFICIIIVIFLRPEFISLIINNSFKNEVIIICISIVIGFLIYSIHKAYFDGILYKITICSFIKKNGVPQEIISKHDIKPSFVQNSKFPINNWIKIFSYCIYSTKDPLRKFENYNSTANCKEKKYVKFCQRRILSERIFFEIYTQSFLREAKKRQLLKTLNANMENRYSMLAFLYCSAYSFIFISICVFIKYGYDQIFNLKSPELLFEDFILRFICAFIFGIILLSICNRFSYRLLIREMWIINEYWI
jgi:hypothetical protein